MVQQLRADFRPLLRIARAASAERIELIVFSAGFVADQANEAGIGADRIEVAIRIDRFPIVEAGGPRALDEAHPSVRTRYRGFEAAYAELGTAQCPVDVLVNCAGFMELVSFAGTPWELGRALLDVDLVSPLRLMSLTVPAMKERGRGIVVNVASLAGLAALWARS